MKTHLVWTQTIFSILSFLGYFFKIEIILQCRTVFAMFLDNKIQQKFKNSETAVKKSIKTFWGGKKTSAILLFQILKIR